MKKVCATLACLLIAQTATAGDFNPFLGKSKAKTKVAQKSSAKKASAPSGNGGALPPLPPVSPVPQNPGMGFAPAISSPEKQAEKPYLKVVGRIGNQVTVADVAGNKTVVTDGTMKNGCFVSFPEAVCNENDIAQAKARFVAVPATPPPVVRPSIPVHLNPTSPAKDFINLKAEVDQLKAQLASPPSWVAGAQKNYKDATLGNVTVYRNGKEMIFKVENGNEGKADTFFGRNVLKKERKSDHTYYALAADKVKTKE